MAHTLLPEAERLYGHLQQPRPHASQRERLHALLTLRPPGGLALSEQFHTNLHQLLAEELQARGGVVDPCALPSLKEITGTRLCLWQGDITRLAAGAIVNAANEQMLGCFDPAHRCIDNVIHRAAGPRLRDECGALVDLRPERCLPEGRAEITGAHELPAGHVIHTVGPRIMAGEPVQRYQEEELASCYRSCLELVAKHGCRSVAFCCISTGLFGFPRRPAASIAVSTVLEWLQANNGLVDAVVFDVFSADDYAIYREILGKCAPAGANANTLGNST